MERIVPFARKEGDSYLSRLPGKDSSQQASTHSIRSIQVRTVFRPTTPLAAGPTKNSPPPRTTRESNRVVTFLEPNTDLSTTAYKPQASTASEYVFVLDEDSNDHTDFYVTVDQDSTIMEVRHSDHDEEQILILNRSNNCPPYPRPQTRYGGPSDIPHADGTTLTNHRDGELELS